MIYQFHLSIDEIYTKCYAIVYDPNSGTPLLLYIYLFGELSFNKVKKNMSVLEIYDVEITILF